MDNIKQLAEFEDFVNNMWSHAFMTDFFSDLMASTAVSDPRMTALYLTQVYHYAVHTPRHQALVGVNTKNENVKYMQYCFEHALEETGHELMALKDMQSLGFAVDKDSIPGRLPSTDLLIAFLYMEANSDNPVHHLGYGFWSENACPFLSEFMANMMEAAGLDRKQLTFYSSHVTIDENHAREVRNIISQVVKTESEWKELKRVAQITFDLTMGIIKETFDVYQKMETEYVELFGVFNKQTPVAIGA